MEPNNKIKETFEQVLRTLEIVEFKDDNTINIIPEGREMLEKELNELLELIKNKRFAQYIKTTGVDSFLKLVEHVAKLKSKQVSGASLQHEFAKPKMKVSPTAHDIQIMAVLDCLKTRPECFKGLHHMLLNTNVRSDGSVHLDVHHMKDIHGILKLDTSTFTPDNAIILTKDDLTNIIHNLEKLAGCPPESAGERLTLKDNTEKSADAKTTKTLVNVQVLDPLPSGATTSFIDALKEELNLRGIRAIMTDLQAFNSDDTGSNLVIVICNNHSRLQGNLANTIQQIKKQRLKRILMVVLHCKKRSYLPTFPSKSELKQSTGIEDISEIVDMAFHKDECKNGIYDCEMNKYTIELIEQLAKDGNLGCKVNNSNGC